VCGKIAYSSKADAKAAWKRTQAAGSVDQYRCSIHPESWHNGHLKQAVRSGEASRDVMTSRGALLGVRGNLVFCCGFEVTGEANEDSTISWRCRNCDAMVRLPDDEANAILIGLYRAGVRPTLALVQAARGRSK
jgi:hypothetical protein